MALEWKDEYGVHNALIDSHHRYLFVLLNRLAEELPKGAEAQSVRSALDELKNYAVYHFSVEEHIMTEQQNPLLEMHAAEHAAFAKKVVEMEACLDSNFHATADELVKFLSEWLVHHIMKIDKISFEALES